jgi:hypothetical protein
MVVATAHGALPLSSGYIPRLLAQRQATAYLSQAVGFFLTPNEGELVVIARPVWRFLIQLQLPQSGLLGRLGQIDVDAQTAIVIPLTTEQITTIQGQADALARSQTQPAAA